VNELIEENIHINKQYEDESAEVDKRDKIIGELKSDKENIITEGEENIQKISDIKRKFSNFNSYYDSFTIRLEDIKDKIASLQKQNKDLQGENARLNATLTISNMDALTPRPDYKRLVEGGKIPFQVFDSFGRAQVVSTAAIVEELANKGGSGTDGENSTMPKIINPAISKINKGGSRSRAGSFNVANSPLKMNKIIRNDLDSPSTGKSSFGRSAARPSGFSGNMNTPNLRPAGMSQFGGSHNLSPPSNPFYDFKEKSDSPESNSSSPRDDRSPSQFSGNSSPTNTHSEGTPKSPDGKFTLRIQVPSNKRREVKEDVFDSVVQLLAYIGRTKDEAKEYVTSV